MTVTRAFLLLVALFFATGACALEIKPFKDRLFSYSAMLAGSDPPAYRIVAYDEMRDINGRDEVPERRVRRDYVSLGVKRQQADMVLKGAAGHVAHFAVGRQKGASVITVYLHGQGGSRKQGVNDYSFGGNFNRIKNLMAENGGLYLSPDFSDFGEKGASEVAALVSHYAAASPGARVIIACGSMGGHLCWALARRPDIAPKLGGLMLLGSLWDDGYAKSAAYKARVPVFFGHGSADTVFPVANQEAFFRSLAGKGYPVRFVRFETGSHGTPIRMTDWRETINWMLSVR